MSVEKVSRRELLQRAGVVAATTALSGFALGEGVAKPINEGAAAARPAFEWIRSARLMIAEGYAPPFYPSLDYEAEKALALARRLNCDALRYPTYSYVAFFPTKTKLPHHPELGGRDPFRDTVNLFHDAGLKVVAYNPLNHPFMDVQSNNPEYRDWMRYDADGQPLITRHMGWTRFYEGCLNSPLRAQIRERVREVVTNYPVDLMYFDGPYEGMDQRMRFCHCQYCKAAYQKARGKEHSAAKRQTAGGSFATATLQQIHVRRSDLEQERAQLSAEHGANFPRVVEIGRQLQDLDHQKKFEDGRLVDQFRGAWQTAIVRERMVRRSLAEKTGAGMKQNQAATEYAVMRQEANSSHDLYMRVQEKVQEAGLAAGIHRSNISVVDLARQPMKPVAPDLPLYMAITFFVGLWLALGAALLSESLSKPVAQTAAVLLAAIVAVTAANGQAPTPSTSGLPTGVVLVAPSQQMRSQPNPKEAPAVWNGAGVANKAGQPGAGQPAFPMAGLIGPGDSLEISEYHTPEFRSVVRVSMAGTVRLPMVGDVQIGGLDEQAAARAIEAALLSKGMLLHPLVSVLVTTYCRAGCERAGRGGEAWGLSVRGSSSAAGPDLCRIGADSECGEAGERLLSERSGDAASGGARSEWEGQGWWPQSGTEPWRHRAGEPSRIGLCGWRRDAAGRISSGSGAGADGGAGDFAGLGADAKRGDRKRPADSRAEGRTNSNFA